MAKRPKIVAAVLLLVPVHLAIFLAGFFAPYDPSDQNRNFPFAPPNRIHFVDTSGRLHLRPFVYLWVARPDSFHEYMEARDREYPIQFLVAGDEYKIAGVIRSHLHFVGVQSPGQIFLAGTDDYGRDELSRLLHGGQLSMAAALLATGVSLLLGLVIGSLSGFYGNWIDASAMRLVELFLVLPWLYFLLAVRSFLPLHISAARTFLLLVGVIGAIGWARPARLVRGVVLSAKNRAYVQASRGFGASDAHILRHHILPDTHGVLLTQGALLVPQYIVAEVTLSFLGLGLGDSAPSWGNLLAALQHYSVLVSYWWMFGPAVALVIVSLGYLRLADAIQERL